MEWSKSQNTFLSAAQKHALVNQSSKGHSASRGWFSGPGRSKKNNGRPKELAEQPHLCRFDFRLCWFNLHLFRKRGGDETLEKSTKTQVQSPLPMTPIMSWCITQVNIPFSEKPKSGFNQTWQTTLIRRQVGSAWVSPFLFPWLFLWLHLLQGLLWQGLRWVGIGLLWVWGMWVKGYYLDLEKSSKKW